VRVLQVLLQVLLQALQALRACRVRELLPEPERAQEPEPVRAPQEPVSSPLVSHSRPLQMKTSRRKAAIQ